jgi:hypothetical protein
MLVEAIRSAVGAMYRWYDLTLGTGADHRLYYACHSQGMVGGWRYWARSARGHETVAEAMTDVELMRVGEAQPGTARYDWEAPNVYEVRRGDRAPRDAVVVELDGGNGVFRVDR